jgi:hypothetical protein
VIALLRVWPQAGVVQVVVQRVAQFEDAFRQGFEAADGLVRQVFDDDEEVAFLLERECHGSGVADGGERVADPTAALEVCDFVEQSVSCWPTEDNVLPAQGDGDVVEPFGHETEVT